MRVRISNLTLVKRENFHTETSALRKSNFMFIWKVCISKPFAFPYGPLLSTECQEAIRQGPRSPWLWVTCRSPPPSRVCLPAGDAFAAPAPAAPAPPAQVEPPAGIDLFGGAYISSFSAYGVPSPPQSGFYIIIFFFDNVMSFPSLKHKLRFLRSFLSLCHRHLHLYHQFIIIFSA